ncbi:M20 family metallopeptidase [Sporolactobacillus pectinivorans]|uniref:M20 family metallopeptidase n=1 Tax=Sporolactobacillus pectinivorans TaxID=1591408 RepID=UPI001EFE8821|nr:M20 family metallopeptidase [Sporolactobacillus pectinivorans]
MVADIMGEVNGLIEGQAKLFGSLSEQIWSYAELSFAEQKSMDLLIKTFEKKGFSIERGLAGLKTSFIASFGSGKPVIAILGEYDALAGLSQKKNSTIHDPVTPNGSGHGCGHNLLGVGSLAAAFAVKDYLVQHHLAGTVRFYGCPAEERGNGKAYMAREGCFEDIDAAFSWHPGSINVVQQSSSNAVIEARFSFDGVSAHAAALPELGRSALDAIELMNVGVNYLREHMPDKARVHYAVTNTGGSSPNVVQSHAEELYLVRSPKPNDVRTLFERVVNVARGAALMTETKMSYKIEGGCHNLIPNTALHQVMLGYMKKIGFPEISGKDLDFVRAIYHSLGENEKKYALSHLDPGQRAAVSEKPIEDWIMPLPEKDVFMEGSTDVSDVSWNVPTAQCMTATWAFGTVPHTWQVVAQGTHPYALNAALFAGKAIACTAIQTMTDSELLTKAKQEFKERLSGQAYDCLIPEDIKPPEK